MYRPVDRQNLSAPSDERDRRATIHPEKNQNAKGRRKSESLCADPNRDSSRNPARKDNPFPDQSATQQLHEPRRQVFLESYQQIKEWSFQFLSLDQQNVDRCEVWRDAGGGPRT